MRFVLSLLLIANTGAAAALDYEMAVGRSDFCCLQDGVWWQSQFGFNGSTRSLAWELGVRQRFGNWGVAARYADLGEATGQNVATMRDDEFGKFDTSKPCDTNTQQNCLGYFSVAQHVRSAMFGASYRFTVQGVGIEPEIGQAFYISSMKVQIICPNCGIGSKYAFGGGGTFTSTSEIRRSPYLSLRLVYKNAMLTYRYINNIDGNGSQEGGIESQFATGLTHGPVNQLLLGAVL